MKGIRERAQRAQAGLTAADPADRVASMEDVRACVDFVLRVTAPDLRNKVHAILCDLHQPGPWDPAQIEIAGDRIMALLTEEKS